MNLLWQWSRGAAPFSRVNVYTPQPVPHPWMTTSSLIRNKVLRGNRVGFLWENTKLRRVARRDALLFCPSERIPVGYQGSVVVAIFAVLPQRHSPLAARYWLAAFHERLHAYAARHADLVLTMSGDGRQRIAETYGIGEDRIRVVQLAPASHFRPIEDMALIEAARQKYLGEKTPFVLFVGTLSERRNVPLLIQAFADARRNGRLPHRLLLVGTNPAGYDIAGLAAAAGLGAAVIHAGAVSDEDLVLLYNAADALVHSADNSPGLPVLEAIATGTPVVTVRSGPIVEVAGDTALLVEEPTREALANGLEALLGSETSRARWAERARAAAGRYTWDRTAKETLAILAEVAGR